MSLWSSRSLLTRPICPKCHRSVPIPSYSFNHAGPSTTTPPATRCISSSSTSQSPLRRQTLYGGKKFDKPTIDPVTGKAKYNITKTSNAQQKLLRLKARGQKIWDPDIDDWVWEGEKNTPAWDTYTQQILGGGTRPPPGKSDGEESGEKELGWPGRDIGGREGRKGWIKDNDEYKKERNEKSEDNVSAILAKYNTLRGRDAPVGLYRAARAAFKKNNRDINILSHAKESRASGSRSFDSNNDRSERGRKAFGLKSRRRTDDEEMDRPPSQSTRDDRWEREEPEETQERRRSGFGLKSKDRSESKMNERTPNTERPDHESTSRDIEGAREDPVPPVMDDSPRERMENPLRSTRFSRRPARVDVEGKFDRVESRDQMSRESPLADLGESEQASQYFSSNTRNFKTVESSINARNSKGSSSNLLKKSDRPVVGSTPKVPIPKDANWVDWGDDWEELVQNAPPLPSRLDRRSSSSSKTTSSSSPPEHSGPPKASAYERLLNRYENLLPDAILKTWNQSSASDSENRSGFGIRLDAATRRDQTRDQARAIPSPGGVVSPPPLAGRGRTTIRRKRGSTETRGFHTSAIFHVKSQVPKRMTKAIPRASRKQNPPAPLEIESLSKSFPEQKDMVQGQTAWAPTKKLSYAAMAGIRTLYAADPTKFSKNNLSKQFHISYEAVCRVLRSKYASQIMHQEGSNFSASQSGRMGGAVAVGAINKLAGTKWDRSLTGNEHASPVGTIHRALRRRQEQQQQNEN